MTEKAAMLGEIFDNLRRVFQVVHEHSRQVERETGLTGPQLWAIKVIAEKQPIKISAIAKRMYLHATTVVGIIDRLEARKLVKRVRSQEDRRVVFVELTEEARVMLEGAPLVAQGMLLDGLEALSERKLQFVLSGLKTMVDILGVEDMPPKLILSPEVNVPAKTSESGS